MFLVAALFLAPLANNRANFFGGLRQIYAVPAEAIVLPLANILTGSLESAVLGSSTLHAHYLWLISAPASSNLGGAL